jgi:hypothetical protein
MTSWRDVSRFRRAHASFPLPAPKRSLARSPRRSIERWRRDTTGRTPKPAACFARRVKLGSQKLRRECRIVRLYLTTCALLPFQHTRLRVRPAPGIPCALCLSEGHRMARLGREIAPRECPSSSFRGAPLGASPESIPTSSGYGFRAHRFAMSRNDDVEKFT